MVKQDQPLEYLHIDDLELWEEANVRKRDPMQNIDELSNNIRQNGVRVPLLVRGKNARGKYGVFSGQRRLFACAKAGIEKIPCFVFDGIRVTQARILSLSENLYRQSMDYEDRSRATEQLLGHFKNRKKVAAALGVDVATVKRYIGYSALPEEIKLLTKERKITPTTAIDIYTKFVDENKALKVCMELSKIPIREKKKRHSMVFAIKAAKNADTVEKIKKAAKSIEGGVEYNLLLPGKKSKTIEKIATARFTTKEEIATEMLLDRLQQFEDGEML